MRLEAFLGPTGFSNCPIVRTQTRRREPIGEIYVCTPPNGLRSLRSLVLLLEVQKLEMEGRIARVNLNQSRERKNEIATTGQGDHDYHRDRRGPTRPNTTFWPIFDVMADQQVDVSLRDLSPAVRNG